MNIIFHTVASFGIAVSLSASIWSDAPSRRKLLLSSVAGFTLGIIFHGVWDYIPHCYPLSGVADALVSLSVMLIILIFAKGRRKVLTGACFLGGVFPDVIDLGPNLLNQYLGLNLFSHAPIFPWHYSEYSGSIYSGNCAVSCVNILLLGLVLGIVMVVSRRGFVWIFREME